MIVMVSWAKARSRSLTTTHSAPSATAPATEKPTAARRYPARDGPPPGVREPASVRSNADQADRRSSTRTTTQPISTDTNPSVPADINLVGVVVSSSAFVGHLAVSGIRHGRVETSSPTPHRMPRMRRLPGMVGALMGVGLAAGCTADGHDTPQPPQEMARDRARAVVRQTAADAFRNPVGRGVFGR